MKKPYNLTARILITTIVTYYCESEYGLLDQCCRTSVCILVWLSIDRLLYDSVEPADHIQIQTASTLYHYHTITLQSMNGMQSITYCCYYCKQPARSTTTIHGSFAFKTSTVDRA